MTTAVHKPVGRPPSFTNGHSTTRVRLRLSRDEWSAVEREAENQGKSFREFLRCRLRKCLADVIDSPETPPPLQQTAGKGRRRK